MLKELRTALVCVVLMTVVFGGLYPLLITGVAQPLFGKKADGDMRLLGVKDPNRRNFLPRPSATGYSTTATFFANAGPNGKDTAQTTTHDIQIYARREGIPPSRVPASEGQSSASGIDPDITPGDARIQARRIAQARGVPLARVLALVARERHGRVLGVIGEPTVNVNDLNRGLERLTR